jgi:hypothetical protein
VHNGVLPIWQSEICLELLCHLQIPRSPLSTLSAKAAVLGRKFLRDSGLWLNFDLEVRVCYPEVPIRLPCSSGLHANLQKLLCNMEQLQTTGWVFRYSW